jgi:hypothetical protein
MQIEERIYYQEEQKMDANWIVIFVLISSITTLAIAIISLYNDHRPWVEIVLVVGAILLSDVLVVLLVKTMRLELAISKKGLHYKMTIMAGKTRFINWAEVEGLHIRKSPATGYGKHYKFRYGEVYSLNRKKGVEISLKSGKKKYFSLKDADEFIRTIKNLDLKLPIT